MSYLVEINGHPMQVFESELMARKALSEWVIMPGQEISLWRGKYHEIKGVTYLVGDKELLVSYYQEEEPDYGFEEYEELEFDY